MAAKNGFQTAIRVAHEPGPSSWTILCEVGRVEDLFSRGHIEEPVKQQIGINAFDKLPFTAYRIQGLQQQHLQDRSGGTLGRPNLL